MIYDFGRAAQYRRTVEAEPTSLDPYLNLRCILCNARRVRDAAELYRAQISQLPSEPLLHCNLAVALQDQGRLGGALTSYGRCLQLAPDFADAHFNVTRMYETLGNGRRAIQHFNEYRKLQRELMCRR